MESNGSRITGYSITATLRDPKLIILLGHKRVTTKQEATDLRVVNQLPLNYLFDSAAHRMMVVPDKQMADFQMVLDMSMQEGGLINTSLEIGAKVVVAKGPLRGVEGFVTQSDGKYYVAVSLLGSVFAKAQVPRAYLELI